MVNTIKALTRWKVVLLIALSSRAVLFIFSFLVNHHAGVSMFDLWIRWDGPHYIDLAKFGYQSNGDTSLFIVFYPLYPLFIKLFSLLGLSFSLAAILIPTVFSVIASVLLYELTLLDFNKKTALLAVWFLNIFPTSLFLQGSYTESMFLTFSLLAIYLFRKQRPSLSGLSGLLSSVTRINGVLLLPLFVFETKTLRQLLITIILTPIGFGIYLLINYLTFHNFFYFTIPLRDHWFKELTFPWVGLSNLVHSVPPIQDPNFYIYASEIIGLIFILIMTLIVLLKVRISYGYYMFLNLLLFTSTSFILSTPRYALILFPIYIAIGRIANKYILVIISLSFISLLLLATYIYTQGRWVS